VNDQVEESIFYCLTTFFGFISSRIRAHCPAKMAAKTQGKMVSFRHAVPLVVSLVEYDISVIFHS
jgi:hypothetical protein